MTWLKVDDRAFDDPRFGRVSRDARLMHLEALAKSMGTDGTGDVTRYALRRATDAPQPEALAAELVAAGLWTATDDGWHVQFMLEDQITPEEIARQRDFHRARQTRHRKHVVGDHRDCDPRFCSASRNASRNASNDASVTLPRPDPTRPGEGRGTKARSAPPPPPAGGASRAGRGKYERTPEQKAKISASVRASHERARAAFAADQAERDRRAEEARQERAVEQKARDEEWLALGGDPSAVPVTDDDLLALKARKGLAVRRRPLR